MTDRVFSRAERRAIKAASVKADRKGCACCHQPFNAGGVDVVVETERGFACVHLECVKDDQTMVAVGTTLTATDPFIAIDEKWFAEHPDRNHYIRRVQCRAELEANRKRIVLLHLKQSGAVPADTAKDLETVLEAYDRNPNRVCVASWPLRGVRQHLRARGAGNAAMQRQPPCVARYTLDTERLRRVLLLEPLHLGARWGQQQRRKGKPWSRPLI